MYEPPLTITPTILNLVADITEAVTKLQMAESGAMPPMLRRANKIKTITGTLEIEGNTLGIEKVTALLEGKRVLGTPREIAEVQGAIRVYESLERFDYRSLDDLLRAHKMLMEGILENPGRFRNTDVGVGGSEGVVHVAPPYAQVPKLMGDLFGWLNRSDIHPLIKSSVFHYELEFIHPFIDGNGRIGRLWQTLVLYEWKEIFAVLPVESVVREHQQRYYKALEEAGSMGESTPFVEFMLEAIRETCQNVPVNVPNNVPEKRWESLLSLLKENGRMRAEELAKIFGVSAKTIKRDIARLKAEGKIRRVGSAKSGHWEVMQ